MARQLDRLAFAMDVTKLLVAGVIDDGSPAITVITGLLVLGLRSAASRLRRR